ncbi:MAG: DNA-binding transcriptional MerR regulator [Phenylobacterium sp.]
MENTLGEIIMALMTVAQVAEFLGVKEIRVERLERESLLVSKEKADDGTALFDEGDVQRYKDLAARLGGI